MQVHAPGAKHADQYTPENNTDTDIWDTFLGYLKDSDVEVFGITDYFSIENYEKILEKTQNKPEFKDKVFFPNIELRLNISANKAGEEIHIHLIFDNYCPLKKIKTFLSNLKTTQTKAEGNNFSCKPEDLDIIGYDTVSVDLKEIRSSLDSTFGKDKPYLIAGAYRGQGGFIYGQEQGESKRKKVLSDEVDKFCDFIFGKERDKEWFLRSDRYENKDIRAPEKSVISTSDCHSFEDCRKRLGQESYMAWIKADKTFEGLKQILFEPADRVYLGYSAPENKKPYYVIDKVRFIDNSQGTNFLPDIIELNQNLTTIIGGKSTGKSLLLYYIAKTIDHDEVSHRFSSQPLNEKYDQLSDFNFEVVWADGGKTYLQSSGGSQAKTRKIIYIPQNYLNKLSEMDIKSKAALNKFVKDVLLQDENIKTNYDKSNSEVKKLLQTIQSNITIIFQLRQEILEIQENIKKYGEETGINKYIEQLKKTSNEIQNKSGLKEIERQQYESLLKTGKRLKTELSILDEDKKIILLLNSEVIKNIDNVKKLCADQLSSLGDIEVKNQFEKMNEIFKNTKNEIEALIKNAVSFTDNKIRSKTKDIENTRENFKPLMGRVQLQSELKKKYEEIQKEQYKLNQIAILKKQFEAKRKSYNSKKEEIISAYRKVFEVYNSMRNEFKKYENQLQDISLKILIGFNEQKFNDEVINSCLNKRDIKKKASNDSAKWKDEYQYQYEQAKHLNFIESVFNSVIRGEIKTIRNKDAKDAIVKLLENYFDLDFKISYKNDFLDKMSPGKKGLVLLRLLIDLSSEEWPILLDQPEDDLDNRSVYHDLVSFIKRKKKERQIIIVTHNPNLTVGADSEEVIVANQEGQEQGRENEKYKFEYVSGALENNFVNSKQQSILLKKGIRQHACEILEGGEEAFLKREQKYNFKQR